MIFGGAKELGNPCTVWSHVPGALPQLGSAEKRNFECKTAQGISHAKHDKEIHTGETQIRLADLATQLHSQHTIIGMSAEVFQPQGDLVPQLRISRYRSLPISGPIPCHRGHPLFLLWYVWNNKRDYVSSPMICHVMFIVYLGQPGKRDYQVLSVVWTLHYRHVPISHPLNRSHRLRLMVLLSSNKHVIKCWRDKNISCSFKI